MSAQFKVGDLVRLKSGGPWMVVSECPASNGSFSLQFWNEKSMVVQSVYLKPEVIEHVPTVTTSA